MTTTLYPQLDLAPGGTVTKPDGALATWSGGFAATFLGANAKALGTGVPAGPQADSGSLVIQGNSVSCGMAQYVSVPLSAQTISGTLTVGFALSETGTNVTMQARFALLVMKPDGTVRGTLIAQRNIGSTTTNVNGERTQWATSIALTSVVCSAGDEIVLEFGALETAGSNSAAHCYTSGTTAITANNATTSDAQAFLTFSGTITFTPNTQTAASTLSLATAAPHLLTRAATSTEGLTSAAPHGLTRPLASTLALTTTASAVPGSLHTEGSTLALTTATTRRLTRTQASLLALTSGFSAAAPGAMVFASTLALGSTAPRLLIRTQAGTLTGSSSAQRTLIRPAGATLQLAGSAASLLARRTSSTLALLSTLSISQAPHYSRHPQGREAITPRRIGADPVAPRSLGRDPVSARSTGVDPVRPLD